MTHSFPFNLLFTAAVALALSACSGPTFLGGAGDITVVQNDNLPPPQRSDLYGSERPYLIGPLDKLTVDVFGVEELSKEVQADASGRISLPLIGVIEAAGRTPSELSNTIEDRLRGRFVRDPQVSVNLAETVSQVMTIDGQVREPGLYPVIGQMTLMRAVATAKGTTEFAKKSDVVVFRTVGEQRMVALFNLKLIQRGVYKDPEIFANDVIVVGDSPGRRLFKDVLQASPLITTPIIALLNR